MSLFGPNKPKCRQCGKEMKKLHQIPAGQYYHALGERAEQHGLDPRDKIQLFMCKEHHTERAEVPLKYLK